MLLVGAGGLGSPAALYLAAAGVGCLGIVDNDVVDEPNLQRQVLHGTAALGRSKTASASERLHDLNPHIEVEAHTTRLTSANALETVSQYEVVIDGSDNFPTRYLVNDVCVLTGRPDVYGAIYRFDGQVSVFATPDGPCYRCLFRDPPPPELVPSCEDAGVLGVVPGIVGSLQALEAVKLLLGIGETLAGRLLSFDGLRGGFRELPLTRDPECPVCGDNPSVTAPIDYEAFCGSPAREEPASDRGEITPRRLAAALAEANPPQLVDVREDWEWRVVRLESAALIPLDELSGRVAELAADRPVVAYCHHGVRSIHAREVLRAAGFSDVRSLTGGIDAWARDVEPGMERY